MKTGSLLARYMVVTLKEDSVDGHDERRYAQAGASRSPKKCAVERRLIVFIDESGL